MLSPLSSPTSSSPPTVPQQDTLGTQHHQLQCTVGHIMGPPHDGSSHIMGPPRQEPEDLAAGGAGGRLAKRSRPNSVHNSRNDIANSVIV